MFKNNQELFDTAQKQPLFGVLQDKMAYLFSCVNILTAEQEIFEDDKKICEIRPFFQLLRLIEKQDDRTEKQLNAQIGFLIGKGNSPCLFELKLNLIKLNSTKFTGLHEFDGLKISEVNNFRWRAREFSTQVEHKRSRNNWLEQIYYNYPVRVEPITGIPKYLRPVLESTKNQILIELRFESSKVIFVNPTESCYNLN